MNLTERILAFREGGHTIRAHTMQYTGPYNVAIHSYNAATMLLLLNPNASTNLIKAVLWHDVPERWTGDVPAPAKWKSPLLKATLDVLETKILDKLGVGTVFLELTPDEQYWLLGVDLLELYVWSQEQLQMGNPTMGELSRRVLQAVLLRAERIPKPVLEIVANFKWSRSVECDELI